MRHYPLVETFDAWESWDTIHTAPDRLRWGIWAYSHAGVKTPDGLRLPAGSYISWGHHGRDLLSAEDVAFLSRELNAAARDAQETIDIAGPTLVYSRDVVAGQIGRPKPDLESRDLLDEQVRSVIKWPVPVLSITRAEWLTRVHSDLFLFGATAGLPTGQAAAITAMAARGQAMAFFSPASGGRETGLTNLLGVSSAPHAPRIADRVLRATPGAGWPSTLAHAGAFDAPPPTMRTSAPTGSVVYAFGDSVGLVLDQTGGRNLALWEPVPIFDYWFRPLRDLMNGDPTPFAVVAATLDRQLVKAGAFAAATIDARQSGTVAAWVRRDGAVSILAGNLEEGLRDDADRSRHLTLKLPEAWTGCDWRSAWGTRTDAPADHQLKLELAAEGSELLTCRRAHPPL